MHQRKITRFTAQVIVLSLPGEFKVGYEPLMRVHTAGVPCKVLQLLQRLNKQTGEVLEDDPHRLLTSQAGTVVFKPMSPLWVEVFNEFAPLGRFALFDLTRCIGCGVVKSIVYDEDDGNKPLFEKTKKEIRTETYWSKSRRKSKAA